MTGWRAILSDRRRRQRGSVLSGLLVMVALLSILIGALMTELSSSFVLSHTLSVRVAREATDNSAVELGLYQLAHTAVPPVCARDGRGPWFVNSLNGSAAAVTQTCTGIVPDQTSELEPGSYTVDGINEVAYGRDEYIVGSQTGRVWAYPVGSTASSWLMDTGGALTSSIAIQLGAADAPDAALLVPSANPASACGGACVEVYEEPAAGPPGYICSMAAASAVTSVPGYEIAATGSPYFPTYAFFGDAGGNLYVYDASTDAQCPQLAHAGGLGGGVVGQTLVYTGMSGQGRKATSTADIFVVVTNSNSTQLEHWQYSEPVGGGAGTLIEVASVQLAVGGNGLASGPSVVLPTPGSTISLAVAGRSGSLRIASITVTSGHSGSSYAISSGAAGSIAGSVTAPPYWCRCPGQDLVGVGSTNGSLYLLDTNLALTGQYDGAADGRPAIQSSPVADLNGDWYFGADDGFVYDVEIPTSGQQLFKAARFGPGGTLRSSVVAAACGTSQCIYVASASSGGYFARVGTTRMIELRACVTTTAMSATCAANPRLWASAEVGPPSVVGGQGISVRGWSYYSP